MRQVLDVNILDDPATQKTVGTWGLPGAVAGLVLTAAGVGLAGRDGGFGAGAAWCALVAAIYLVSLPLHELVHALFFKAFGPAGTRVTFGFKSGMLYAGCPGTVLGRRPFTAVLLAPFALLTLAYAALGLALRDPLLACCLFFLHASGCAGDAYFAWLIRTHPEADLCEDTAAGIRLWRSGE